MEDKSGMTMAEFWMAVTIRLPLGVTVDWVITQGLYEAGSTVTEVIDKVWAAQLARGPE